MNTAQPNSAVFVNDYEYVNTVHCVQKKSQNVFNIFYKTWAILMKFGTPFSE